MCHVRVRSRRRRVRHSHVGHHARPLARLLSPLHTGHHLIFRVVCGQTLAIAHVAGQTDRLEIAFDARQVRRGRARRVGHLTVHAVCLREILENKPARYSVLITMWQTKE